MKEERYSQPLRNVKEIRVGDLGLGIVMIIAISAFLATPAKAVNPIERGGEVIGGAGRVVDAASNPSYSTIDEAVRSIFKVVRNIESQSFQKESERAQIYSHALTERGVHVYGTYLVDVKTVSYRNDTTRLKNVVMAYHQSSGKPQQFNVDGAELYAIPADKDGTSFVYLRVRKNDLVSVLVPRVPQGIAVSDQALTAALDALAATKPTPARESVEATQYLEKIQTARKIQFSRDL